MDIHEWPCRIKSARRKRQLVKTDRDKQLIQLNKRKGELWKQHNALPLVALEHPYQSGWKRFFVLRDEVKRNPKAEFYETLLTKINTVQWNVDKSFKRKKRRRKRYGYAVRQQLLQQFEVYSWGRNRMKLTEEERACFTCVEIYHIKTRRMEINYVFAEPWRYVLKVAPNIVTHRRPIDGDIQRELGHIDNHITNNYLWPRIHLLTRGRNYRWRERFAGQPKYINTIKNISRYSPKQVFLDLET